MFNFTANLLVSPSVKEFWKSADNWQSYGQTSSVVFFTHSVHYCVQAPQLTTTTTL